jgi:hypothetical protein
VGASMTKLRSGCQTAQIIIKDVSHELDESIDVIRRDETRLTRINHFIDGRKEQTSRQIAGLLRDVEKACRDSTNDGVKLLESKLSFWRTWRLMWSRSGWQREFQMELDLKLRQRVQPEVEHAVQMLEVDLRGIWPQLNDMLDSLRASDLKARAPRTMHDFGQQRRELLQSVHLALVDRVSGQSIEDRLAQLFNETSTRLRVPAGVAAATGLATVVAAMSSAAVADVTGILAASAAVTGSVLAFRQRRKILGMYSEQMEKKCAEVTQLVEQQLKHAVDIFYAEVSATFQPLAAFCLARRREYEPLLQRAQALQEKFEMLAGRLR